eukprot:CAMPEP_0171322208 /NCGR_PEP_ID=MMETSP0816-20121228/114815_1 /TAXON_ID=420281 /ORGANISM="Proboscia inermis, Strain CCAP1064/1" /LENGTH=68 /DNA_ID=CAMNT_0011820625 /DNA_START=675 /DNA_END=881 /DNA_ORIENTATION=-
MGVHKNKYVEEWTGRREITEKAFQVDSSNIKELILMCIIIPVGIFQSVKSELKKTGGRHYDVMMGDDY